MRSTAARMTSLVASLALVAACLGCAGCMAFAATDLMADVDVEAAVEDGTAITSEQAIALADFGIVLASQVDDGEGNVLVSPLSVECALALLAEGADGETLTQIEAVLGADVDTLEEALPTLEATLDSPAWGDDESLGQLSLANSIWFRDGLAIEQDFLESNAAHYGAAAYQAAFDAGTVDDINSWVSDATDGQIGEVLEELDDDAVICLVNALVLEAAWQSPYDPDYQVESGTFTAADGTEQDAEYLRSTEHYYVEASGATGFAKYYEGGRLAFVALLPDEGSTPEALLAELDGTTWVEALAASEDSGAEARAWLPKFSYDYDADLAETLQAMGMTDAFDEALADLSGMATGENGNVYVSGVVHKTHIEVDEEGTSAAAATVVGASTTSAMDEPEYVDVVLDRPFVYAIVDMESGAPVFLGVLRTLA